MTIKKMLAVLLCLSMIFCSTLPILANNHKALDSKISLLSRTSSGSAGGGGGGGGSSSGGGGGGSSSGGGGGGGGSSSGGGGGGSSSGGSGGGGSSSGGGGSSSSSGGGSSSSSGGSSGGGGSSSSSSSGSSSSSSGGSSGGGSSSSSGASGGGGSSYISGGASGGSGSNYISGGGGGDDISVSSGSPLYYDPSAWDSISDFQEYRDNIINSSNNGGSSSSRSSGGSSSSGSNHSFYDSNGNLISTYDLSAEGSWVSGDGTYGGGAIQTYQGNTNSSGNRSASGGGSSGGTWVQNPNTSKWYFYENANSPSESKRSTGWKEISGSWYYFGQDGAMYQNQITPDGYYVDSNGTWVQQ